MRLPGGIGARPIVAVMPDVCVHTYTHTHIFFYHSVFVYTYSQTHASSPLRPLTELWSHAPWGGHGVGLSDEAGAAGWAGSVVRGPETNVSGPRTHRAVLSVFCFLARANPNEIKVPLRRRGRGAPAQERGVEHRGGAGAAMLKLGEHVPHDWLGHRARACATCVPPWRPPEHRGGTQAPVTDA